MKQDLNVSTATLLTAKVTRYQNKISDTSAAGTYSLAKYDFLLVLYNDPRYRQNKKPSLEVPPTKLLIIWYSIKVCFSTAETELLIQISLSPKRK